MGLNISGLVLNHNYKNDLEELALVLGEEFHKKEETTFGEGCESWKSDEYCDVYFSDIGTLVFLSMEKGGFEFCIDGRDTFSFVLSESTMMFCFNYTQNGQLIRSYFESDDEIQEDEGTPLEIERTEEDKSEVILHLVGEILGEEFYEIDMDAACTRFWLKEPENVTAEAPHEKTSEQKAWWKFW
ncbi:MAG: hypothetical protein HWE22_01595 [Flavobacteriales bacterium]|nr:hypothetical protein [Flavobacteriales bacterium]